MTNSLKASILKTTNNPKGGEKMNFKISLKAARTNADMTQKEAAKLLNVDKSTIGSWEKGKTHPDCIEAEKISEIYGVPLDYINFSSKNSPKASK